MTGNQFVEPDKMGSKVADALEACNWANAPIGNKAILAQAIALLRADQRQGVLLGYIWPEEIDGPNRCRVMTVSRPGDFMPNMIPVYQVPQLIQGEPVAWMYTRPEVEWPQFYDTKKQQVGWKETPLYTHADPAEVERLERKIANSGLALKAQTQNCETLRADVKRLMGIIDEQNQALKEIGDYSHDKSQGPEIQDELWEVRRMAYAAHTTHEYAPNVYQVLRTQLAERGALLRDIASDDLPGNVHPNYRQRAIALLERKP